MSMSDCIKCWNTPCSCGYEYRDWSVERRIEMAAVVLGVSEKTIGEQLNKFIPNVHPQKAKEEPRNTKLFDKIRKREANSHAKD